jgi:ribosomal protein S27E
MSKIGKIATCSGCNQEKPIFSELDDSHGGKRVYCEKCVKDNHEKIKCGRCGQLLLHRELADHLLEYHSEI